MEIVPKFIDKTKSPLTITKILTKTAVPPIPVRESLQLTTIFVSSSSTSNTHFYHPQSQSLSHSLPAPLSTPPPPRVVFSRRMVSSSLAEERHSCGAASTPDVTFGRCGGEKNRRPRCEVCRGAGTKLHCAMSRRACSHCFWTPTPGGGLREGTLAERRQGQARQDVQ